MPRNQRRSDEVKGRSRVRPSGGFRNRSAVEDGLPQLWTGNGDLLTPWALLGRRQIRRSIRA